MDDEEKYLFDLRGYIVVHNALNDKQIGSLSKIVDKKMQFLKDTGAASIKERNLGGSDRTRFLNDDDIAWSSPSLLEWGDPFIEIVDLPTISPYLETILGKHYRLDHDYMLVANKHNSQPLYLHGGGQGAGGPKDIVGPTDGGQCYFRYSNGRFFNGLVAVAFELDTVAPEDGGFACIPGSHKSNFQLPKKLRPEHNIKSGQIPGLRYSDIPDYIDRVSASSGDAIIFTEACQHGTLPWNKNSERQRRTLFYKYCPHAVAWSPCYYNADHYPGLSQNQKNILMPPSAYGSDQRTSTIWGKAQAEQAELIRLRALIKSQE